MTLRDIAWDRLLVDGLPHAHICPSCAALVPVGNDQVGTPYRERHIRWHEDHRRPR